MWPLLFWNIETYYVFWCVALFVMGYWTLRRAERLYGLSGRDASDILFWVLIGVFVGATLGGYIDHRERYTENPAALLRFWESGVSSGPGFIGGGLFGIFKIKRLGVSVDRFAESSSIPCAFMLFIGRIGCFANGCCEGLPTESSLGVRFPFRPDTPVWPSQLFESAASLLIGGMLLILEQRRRRHPEAYARATLFPTFLISYGAYRIAFDFLRSGNRTLGLQTGQYSGIIACLVGVFWLAKSFTRRVDITMS